MKWSDISITMKLLYHDIDIITIFSKINDHDSIYVSYNAQQLATWHYFAKVRVWWIQIPKLVITSLARTNWLVPNFGARNDLGLEFHQTLTLVKGRAAPD